MKKKRFILLLAVQLLVIAAAFLLWGSSLGRMTVRSFGDKAQLLNTFTVSVDGGPQETVTLPHRFTNLEGRTPVTLTTEISPGSQDTVYIKSVYAPAKIYMDDKLLFEFGRPENYPSFMHDPATEVCIIDLNGDNTPATLKMEFLSPLSRSTLTVHPPVLGPAKNVIFSLFSHLAPSLTFSTAQIIYGLSLICISLCLLFVDRKGISFMWLGLLSLLSGLWAFGENNFSALIIKNPSFLYLTAFIGLITFILPLLHFFRSIIDFQDPRPLWMMEFLLGIASAAALLLQLTGLVPFSTSMYFFHAALPLTLIAVAVLVIREFVLYRTSTSGMFILPASVLALTAVLELFSYVFFIPYAISSFFQIGLLFFLLIMGVTAGLAVKESVGLRHEQAKLDFEQHLMDMQIKEQESRSLLLSQHEQLLRQQRHDLRHHLEVVKALARKDNTELQNYLQALTDNIPASSKTFCENRAVNSIISHYDALCKQEGIHLSLHLTVPERCPHMHDSTLCVIFGNLLENAVEACKLMATGEPFIKLNSSLQYDLLTITMDNSFNGLVHMEDDKFLSSKRDGYGIGIDSIRTVAQKSGGDADFHTEGQVFLSSIYVRL